MINVTLHFKKTTRSRGGTRIESAVPFLPPVGFHYEFEDADRDLHLRGRVHSITGCLHEVDGDHELSGPTTIHVILD